jgi:hypothetical protein
LAEVERTSNLKPKTFRRYAQYFRKLAAQIQGVESDASRYDYRNGGLTRWRERVDAIPLAAITPAAVADWRIAYLKRAGSDPRRKLEVNRSFNSALRHCKSLFSSHIINKANFGVKIPRFKVPDGQHGEREAYWFDTLDFERAGSMKFHAPAGVTYETLMTNAPERTAFKQSRSLQIVPAVHLHWAPTRRSGCLSLDAVEPGGLFHTNRIQRIYRTQTWFGRHRLC